MPFQRILPRFMAAGALLIAVAGPVSAQAVRVSAPIDQIIPPAPVPAVKPLKLSDFPGRWIGKGELTFRGGIRNVVNCRITYFNRNPEKLQQSIRCKSDSFNLEIKTDIVDFPRGEITGEWKDRVYNMGGKIRGRIVGNEIKALVRSDSMTAVLNVLIDGDRQTIELKPQNSMLRSMRISLARG
jgi:hypothetical protein